MGIKTPPAYKHPAKRDPQRPGIELKQNVQAKRPEDPKKEKEAKGRGRQSDNERNSPTSEMVRVRVVAFEPLPGEITIYDDMVESGISKKEALLGLLRNAKGKIDDLTASQSKATTQLSYAHGKECVETNWSLPKEKISRLKSRLDPFNILTPRSLGARIGAALIALYERDRTHE
ncbi:hypothetical protein [Nitratireductor sp. XY-223]|uniref:hypothetical protein n=1 Tax=Nitratireductor sp. XY-223 TaxID=2561926 RepID=UPI0010AB45D2|nr:hypothetical protein [Nitratireductor sp. XY-223]